MRIFYYTWNENSEGDMFQCLLQLGYDVVKCHIPYKDYEQDDEFTYHLERIFLEQKCDLFYSFDFFPLIAKTAEKLQKQYVSWVYDCPHNTLYSPSVLSEYVSVFVFDKMQYARLSALKAGNVYHLPLAVNTKRLNELLGLKDADTVWKDDVKYRYEVSFVGSLYENNLYQQINYLPDYVRGYIQGLIAGQRKIYGYNLLDDTLSDEVLNEIRKYVVMNLDASYLVDNRHLYINMLNAEVTHQERVDFIKSAAEYFDVALFTASKSEELPMYIFKGIVSYDTEMPKVFRDSKINLNITLRSIESGIPLRVLDVLAAGGFLITNYQPEIAEYFVDGQEVVMFESKEDMLNKIAYYLEHEEERKQIAYNGWKKVQEDFSYEVQVGKMMEVLEKY